MAERKLRVKDQIEKATQELSEWSKPNAIERMATQIAVKASVSVLAANAAAAIGAEEEEGRRMLVLQTLDWVLGERDSCPYVSYTGEEETAEDAS